MAMMSGGCVVLRRVKLYVSRSYHLDISNIQHQGKFQISAIYGAFVMLEGSG